MNQSQGSAGENRPAGEKKSPPSAKKTGKKKVHFGLILTGVLMIAAGVGYAGNAIGLWSGFTIFFRGWWTLFIIVPCLSAVINRGVRSGALYGVLFGGLLLLLSQYGFGLMWKLAFPAALVSLGLLLLFRSKTFQYRRILDADGRGSIHIPIYRGLFEPRIIVPADEPFRGAEIRTLFAPVTLDLTGIRPEQDAILDIVTLFGSVTVKADGASVLRAERRYGFSQLKNAAGEPLTAGDHGSLHISAACIFAPVTLTR